MRALRIALLLLLCSCTNAHQDDREPDVFEAFGVAEDVWWQLVGPISERCSLVIGETAIMEVSREALQRTCPPETPGVTTGCFLAPKGAVSPPLVLLLDAGPYDVRMRAAAEEWLHLLEWCENGSTSHDRIRNELLPEVERRLGL